MSINAPKAYLESEVKRAYNKDTLALNLSKNVKNWRRKLYGLAANSEIVRLEIAEVCQFKYCYIEEGVCEIN